MSAHARRARGCARRARRRDRAVRILPRGAARVRPGRRPCHDADFAGRAVRRCTPMGRRRTRRLTKLSSVAAGFGEPVIVLDAQLRHAELLARRGDVDRAHDRVRARARDGAPHSRPARDGGRGTSRRDDRSRARRPRRAEERLAAAEAALRDRDDPILGGGDRRRTRGALSPSGSSSRDDHRAEPRVSRALAAERHGGGRGPCAAHASSRGAVHRCRAPMGPVDRGEGSQHARALRARRRPRVRDRHAHGRRRADGVLVPRRRAAARHWEADHPGGAAEQAGPAVGGRVGAR